MSLGKKSTDVDLKYKRRVEGGRVGRLGAWTLGHCPGSHPSFPTPPAESLWAHFLTFLGLLPQL